MSNNAVWQMSEARPRKLGMLDEQTPNLVHESAALCDTIANCQVEMLGALARLQVIGERLASKRVMS